MVLELSKEHELLLACSRRDMEPQIQEKILSIVDDVDWRSLIELADRHGIKPLVYWHLKGLIPEEVEKELKVYFGINARKNLMMQGELLKILKFFNENEIRVVPYKGPILALQVYGNLALREFGDLDLYVDREDVVEVKKILLSQSYQPEIDLKPSREKKFLETQRELGFIHNTTSIPLEVHWTFQDLFISLPGDLWAQAEAKTKEFNNVPIIQPSPEDLMLILSLHNASHRWSRIAWLVDVAELVKTQDINWSMLHEKAKNLAVEKILLINLVLAEDLLGLEVPAEVKESHDTQKIVRSIKKKLLFESEQAPHLLDEVYYNYKLRDSPLYGIEDVIRGLTAPTLYEWKHLQLPPSLFPLYYLLRPIFLIRRHKL